MNAPVSAEPSSTVTLSVTGFIVEAGNIGIGLKHADASSRGVVLECGDRYIELRGIDKEEAKALAKLLTQEVVLRISPVSKP